MSNQNQNHEIAFKSEYIIPITKLIPLTEEDLAHYKK